MEKKELYNFDAVTDNLKGFKWIINSNNVKLVALMPYGDDGKVKLLSDGLLVKRTKLGHGFNSSRKWLKESMPGCDYYYDIKDVPETADLRQELAGNRVVVELDENGIGQIDAIEYNPKNDINNSNITDAQRIITIYEYNPEYESPNFGEICELVNTSEYINDTPIWKIVPKILQNESNIDYALRARRKGVRTVIKIDDKEIPTLMEQLKDENKLENLKEFTTIPGMGDDFIVESNSLVINNEINKTI